MKHSSRRDPCPICSRDKDDKCRWNDEFILCYAGDTFSPPSYLRLGDKIKIGADRYALCSLVSGFAGNSYCFALVDDFDYRFLSYQDKIAYRRQSVKITRVFLRKQVTAINGKITLDQEEFYLMSLDAFYQNKLNIKNAISAFNELLEYATINKRFIVDYVARIKDIIENTKEMKQALDEVHWFEKEHLGSTHPQQSDMRGAQVAPEALSWVSGWQPHPAGSSAAPRGSQG